MPTTFVAKTDKKRKIKDEMNPAKIYKNCKIEKNYPNRKNSRNIKRIHQNEKSLRFQTISLIKFIRQIIGVQNKYLLA